MAYNELKSRGIITSSIGKGYFIANTEIESQHKVFLLFDKLTAYKETLYVNLKDTLKGKGTVQIFFHHNNPKVFKSLVSSALGEYSEFVIMPMDDKDCLEVLEQLPKNKVFILDQGRSLTRNKFPYVCQDFERDIYRIFRENEDRIKNYKRLVLVTKNTRLHLKEIIRGFKDFCKQMPIEHVVITQLENFEILHGDTFIIVDDRDLVPLVKQAQAKNLKLGAELGIISYNEIPLKEIIAGGLTTISTDFSTMGRNMASMILSGKRDKIDNPFMMIHRNSF
jgi:DNA-binding LacI/PurR family transcriptional regulator